tara:strand:- start:2188 stop:3030 length:843 start_codon:yes stop_codon:yes gene_type:complete
MEKYLNIPILNVVGAGTSTAPTGVTLFDTTLANFQSYVLIGDIVFDTTNNEMYVVTAVTSDTELALNAIGLTAQRGTGVADAASYQIFSPESTVLTSGTADGTAASQLIDTSKNFSALGVKIGDTVNDITGATLDVVTGISTTTNNNDTLDFAGDVFITGDVYIVYRTNTPDQYTKLIMSSKLKMVANTTDALNAQVLLSYTGNGAEATTLTYAMSKAAPTATELVAMQTALSDAVAGSLLTEWTNVTFNFPGLTNPDTDTTNAPSLANQEYFFIGSATA